MEITLTTERTVSIRSSRAIITVCSECGDYAQWAAPRQAALLTGMSMIDVYRLIEARRVHTGEASEGLLVCLNSLRKNRSLQGNLLRAEEKAIDPDEVDTEINFSIDEV